MAKIDADTRIKINEMNSALTQKKEAVNGDILKHIYAITPELHKNFQKVN